MKRVVFFFLLLIFATTQTALACQNDGPGVNCRCTVVLNGSYDAALSAGMACGESPQCGFHGAHGEHIAPAPGCAPFTDGMGNLLISVGLCGCPDTEREGWDPSLCWQETPKGPAGCCAQWKCYYYMENAIDECECNEEDQRTGQKCANPQVGDPITIYNGNMTEKDTDLQLPTAFDKGFKFYRTYKSRFSMDSSMGFGWSHNFDVILMPLTNNSKAYVIKDESIHFHHFQDVDNTGVYKGVFSTKDDLVAEADGGFIWHRGNGVTYRFNQDLQFVSRTDGNGNKQFLEYDEAGRLSTVTDEASGRAIEFHYNSDNRIDHITGPVTGAVSDGIWVRYQHDHLGNLTHVSYADDSNGSGPSGFTYKYEDPYDAHNLTEKNNLAGEFIASWQYDTKDRAYKNTTRLRADPVHSLHPKGIEIPFF